MQNPVSKQLDIIIPAYRMHSQSFKNALEGVTEELALKRIDEKTNHVLWMAGNLVNCRYWLANILGIEVKDPNEALFADAKALDPTANYPSLESLKNEWQKISPRLFQQLLAVTEEELAQPFEFGMNVPFVSENKLNMVAMCMGREDYLFGQIGLMRKILGLPGMKYDVDESINY